jgi:hypothetical protein
VIIFPVVPGVTSLLMEKKRGEGEADLPLARNFLFAREVGGIRDDFKVVARTVEGP